MSTATKEKKKVDPTNLDEMIEYADTLDKKDTSMKQDEIDDEILKKFQTEFEDMKTGREPREAEWDVCDGQMEANTYYDEF